MACGEQLALLGSKKMYIKTMLVQDECSVVGVMYARVVVHGFGSEVVAVGSEVIILIDICRERCIVDRLAAVTYVIW